MMKFIPLLFLLTVSLGAQDIWTEDWDAAVAQAKRENKPLLVNFTGSDWCVWCQKLSKEVFATPAYIQKAKDSYVHVKLDFPRNLPQSPALKARNRQLADRYAVEGYPTILLLTPDQQVYGATGYQEGGANNYLTHLGSFQANRQNLLPLLTQADRAQGAEKARLLDRFLTGAAQAGLEKFYSNLAPQIIAADSDGKAGLRKKYELRAQLNTLLAGLTDQSDFKKAEKDLQNLEIQAQSLPETRQEIMYFRALVVLNGQRDNQRAKQLFEEAGKLAPNTRIGQAVPDILKQIP